MSELKEGTYYVVSLEKSSCLHFGGYLLEPYPKKGCARQVHAKKAKILAPLNRFIAAGKIRAVSLEEYEAFGKSFKLPDHDEIMGVKKGKSDGDKPAASEPAVVSSPDAPGVEEKKAESSAEKTERLAKEASAKKLNGEVLLTPEEFNELGGAKEMREYLDGLPEDATQKIKRNSEKNLKDGYKLFYSAR